MEKKEICGKTLNLFVERGYDNTPMSLVAKELGLSKGGLFHHYQTKEKLLYDIITNLLKSNFVPILENARKISDPKQRIIYFVSNFTQLVSNDNATKVVVHDAERLDPVHYEEVRKIWRQTFDLLCDAFSEMQRSGEGRELNSKFVSFAAIGMCSWIFYWFDYSRKESVQELSDTIVEILFNGFQKMNGSDDTR